MTLLLRFRLPHSNRVTCGRRFLHFCWAGVHLIIHVICLLRSILIYSQSLVLHGTDWGVSYALANLRGWCSAATAAEHHGATICGQLWLWATSLHNLSDLGRSDGIRNNTLFREEAQWISRLTLWNNLMLKSKMFSSCCGICIDWMVECISCCNSWLLVVCLRRWNILSIAFRNATLGHLFYSLFFLTSLIHPF